MCEKGAERNAPHDFFVIQKKACEFMRQYVIDGVNLLKRFLESAGKDIGKLTEKQIKTFVRATKY